MDIFINLDTRRLQKSVAISQPPQPNQLDFKRGDAAEIVVRFVRNNVQEELASGSVITFCCKEKGKYDGDALVLTDDFTLSGSEDTAAYSANPSFNTEPLDEALFKDENEENDVAYVDIMGEITWTDGPDGPITSTETFNVRVANDVFRGDEGTPAALPDPDEWMPAALALSGVPLLQATREITVVGNTGASWSIDSGAGSAGESSPSYANTTAGAAGRAALINADSDFPFTAYSVANVIYLVAKPEYPGTAGNSLNFSLSGTDLSAGGSTLTGGVLETATQLGQLGQATVGGNVYSFRATGTGVNSNWEGATPGLFLNPTLGEWRIYRLSGTDAVPLFAPYELDASYP